MCVLECQARRRTAPCTTEAFLFLVASVTHKYSAGDSSLSLRQLSAYYGIMGVMDAPDTSQVVPAEVPEDPALPRAGVDGRLLHPFWLLVGAWAVLCGAFASNHFRWQGADLLFLLGSFLLVTLAWAGIWDSVTSFPSNAASVPSKFGAISGAARRAGPLPFAMPGSPAGRLFTGLARLRAWARWVLWPAAGHALLWLAVALTLAAVLALFLPQRLLPLNGVLAAFLVLVASRRRRPWLLGLVLVQVGLAWSVGHLAFARLTWPSLAAAVCFVAAAWGALRMEQGQPAALWLLDGAQIVVVVLLVVLRQPLAAGATGLLLFGQIALQLAGPAARLHHQATRWTWPWLLLAMLIAAWALP